jgi:transposase
MEHVGGRSGRRSVAVAARASNPCMQAAKKHFTRAATVFDHFHFVTPYNEKLDVLRRCVSGMHRSATKEALKPTRRLLSKRPENLEDHRNLLKRLQETMAINEPLAAACYRNDHRKLFRYQPGKMAV